MQNAGMSFLEPGLYLIGISAFLSVAQYTFLPSVDPYRAAKESFGIMHYSL